MTWESTSVKAQLRSSIQRLGQLQAKKDADAAITRKDIATLLQQGNVALARSKAQKLIQEDSLADLLEVLEQQIGILLDRFSELEQKLPPSSTLLEASSSIIFAARHAQIRELSGISDMLSEQLGQDVASSAMANRDNYVSPVVLRAISRRPPDAAQLDFYLEKIANSYGASWTATPRRQDLVNPLSEVLDPAATPSIDVTRLRLLCVRGIPDEPGWLRPRIWKLFMNVLPVNKVSWKVEITKQRDAYYDLIRRLLKPFTELPTPKEPFSGPDRTLLEVYNHLVRIPVELFGQLDSDPEDFNICPLHQTADDDIHIPFANCLVNRLLLLRRLNGGDQKTSATSSTPEIRLEADPDTTPVTSLTAPNIHSNSSNAPTTLLSSKSITLGSASQKHVSALFRLLYLHASINPGNLSPYVPSLLVPLYSALMQEVEPEDLAHAEADSFWLFEAIVGEFAELEDEEGLGTWMKKLDERLRQADVELSEQLDVMGLNPSLPHYSHRWLSSLLTHTLPLPAIYPVWDVVLSRSGRERGKHPRLDSLIEICAAMLIAAKPLLLKHAGNRKRPGLWGTDSLNSIAQPGDGFLEGLSILQQYPVGSVGGVESILQVATELSQGRLPQQSNGMEKKDQLGLGARIKVTMWKGFTNQVDSPEYSDEEESTTDEEEFDDGDDTETPNQSGQTNSLTSRIANTVWRGITNQSSMEDPPSPGYVPSPDRSRPATLPILPEESKDPPLTPSTQKENITSAPASLWTYTEKLKDSDTMATLAKLSSNWRAKAMVTAWGRQKAPESAPVKEVRSAMTSPVQRSVDSDLRRSSLPIYDHMGAPYTPPPRPAVFRKPRDSFIPPEAASLSFSPTEMSREEESPKSDVSNGGLLERTRNLQSSLLSLGRTPSPRPPAPAPKSAPRPLLLNSSSLMTSQQSGKSRVASQDNEDWADVMKLRNSHLHRDSMSSVSSLSPSDAIYRPIKANRSDYDSDASTSRVIPLNRKSVSPMAMASKTYHSRRPSTASTASSDQGSAAAPSTPVKEDLKGSQDSVDVVSPKDPDTTPNGKADAPVLSEHPSILRRTYRRKPQTSLPNPGDTSDSSVGDITSRATRLRSKRYPPRLSNLHIENTAHSEDANMKAISPSNLTVPWPTEDQDTAATPRASVFDPEDISSSPAKSPRSPKGKEERPRKVSNNSRPRKVSNSNRDAVRRSRDSAAEDGDDEGYDDLLSAYESEENTVLA